MRPLILILLLFVLPRFNYANSCSVDNTQTPNGPTVIGNALAGQQFIACDTGQITSIQINTSGGDIHLYLAAGNGATIPLGTPYQIFPGQPSGLVNLPLSQPFLVDKGALYALAIGNVTEVIFDNTPIGLPANDIDPNGRFSFEIVNNAGVQTFREIPASDLVFGVQINPIPAPIPTLSQWGLLIFGLVLLNLGLIKIHQKEVSFQ